MPIRTETEVVYDVEREKKRSKADKVHYLLYHDPISVHHGISA